MLASSPIRPALTPEVEIKKYLADCPCGGKPEFIKRRVHTMDLAEDFTLRCDTCRWTMTMRIDMSRWLKFGTADIEKMFNAHFDKFIKGWNDWALANSVGIKDLDNCVMKLEGNRNGDDLVVTFEDERRVWLIWGNYLYIANLEHGRVDRIVWDGYNIPPLYYVIGRKPCDADSLYCSLTTNDKAKIMSHLSKILPLYRHGTNRSTS